MAVTFGISSVVIFNTTPFLLAFLGKYFGHYAVLLIFAPIITAYMISISYLKKLEIKKGLYNSYPDVESLDENSQNARYELGHEYKNYDTKCSYSNSLLSKITKMNDQILKNKVDIKFVEKAIIFAKKWHDGQMRKSGEPYYTHLLAVAGIVSDYRFTNIVKAVEKASD